MTDGEMIRVPGARPVLRAKPDARTKEQGWNSRFVLGSIPTYDAVKDRHCVVLTVTARKKKAAVTPIRVRNPAPPTESPDPFAAKTASVTPIVSALRNSPKDTFHDQLANELIDAWTKEGIPEEIFSGMLRAIQAGTQKARIPTLSKELEYLKNNKSPVKKLFDTIMARENSIRVLKEWGERLNGGNLTAEETESIHEALLQHRVFTLEAVEAIASYRKHIHSVTQCDRHTYRAPVTLEGVNYLLKLKTDTTFLSTTALNQLYEFSKKSDPFFIVPATQWNKNNKRELPFPGVLGGKVTRAENILLEETYSINEQRKASVEHRRSNMRKTEDTCEKLEEPALFGTGRLFVVSPLASERAKQEPDPEADAREKTQDTPIGQAAAVDIPDITARTEAISRSEETEGQRKSSGMQDDLPLTGKEAMAPLAVEAVKSEEEEKTPMLEPDGLTKPEPGMVPTPQIIEPAKTEQSAIDKPDLEIPNIDLAKMPQLTAIVPPETPKVEPANPPQSFVVSIPVPEIVEPPALKLESADAPTLEIVKADQLTVIEEPEIPKSEDEEPQSSESVTVFKSSDVSKSESVLLTQPPEARKPKPPGSVISNSSKKGKSIRTANIDRDDRAASSMQEPHLSTLPVSDCESGLPEASLNVSLRVDSEKMISALPASSSLPSNVLSPKHTASPHKPAPPSARKSRAGHQRPLKLTQPAPKPVPPVTANPAKRTGRSSSPMKRASLMSPTTIDGKTAEKKKEERKTEEAKTEEKKPEEKKDPPKAFSPQPLPSSETFKKPVAKRPLALSVSPTSPIKEQPKKQAKAPPAKPKEKAKIEPAHKSTQSASVVTEVKPEPKPEVKVEPPKVEPRTEPLPAASLTKSDISIETFHLYADELRSKVERHITQIPDQMKESFWHEGAFDGLMKRSYPAIMSLNMEERRVGLLGLYIDTLSTKVHRVIISHVSASSLDDLRVVLERCLEFIWEAYPCDEIRIALNYRLIGGVLCADSELMSMLTSLNFRWRSLSISQDGLKTMILLVKRPEEAPEKPFSTMPLFRENFVLRYGLAAQIGTAIRSERQEGLFSLIGPIVCAKEFGGMGPDGEEMSRNETLIASLVAKLPNNFVFPATRVKKSGVVEEALEEIRKQGLEMQGLEKGLETVGVCCCVGLRFPSFDTCLLPAPLGLTEYMRIYEATINHTTFDSRNVYFVPSDDKPYILMIVTLISTDIEVNAFELATDMVVKLTNDYKSCANTVSEIWLPGFTVTNKRVLDRFAGVKTAAGTIKTCSESYDVALSVPIHNIGNIAMKPKEGVVVVKDSFVIGK